MVSADEIHTLAPAGIVAVLTPAPERPLTLQVRSVEVTSVTGLLLGGTRRSVFCPWSALTQEVSNEKEGMRINIPH